MAAGIGRFAAGRAEALPQNQDCKSFAAVVVTVHVAEIGAGIGVRANAGERAKEGGEGGYGGGGIQGRIGRGI